MIRSDGNNEFSSLLTIPSFLPAPYRLPALPASSSAIPPHSTTPYNNPIIQPIQQPQNTTPKYNPKIQPQNTTPKYNPKIQPHSTTHNTTHATTYNTPKYFPPHNRTKIFSFQIKTAHTSSSVNGNK